MSDVSVIHGDSPIILAMPHGGTWVPDDLLARMTPVGRALADTDWHIDQVYSGLLPQASLIRSHVHRYVIDANRDPSGASLYPGQNTTDLCPLTDFDGRDLWLAGQTPSADEIQHRLKHYHAPYHAALAAEIERVWMCHGIAILYDCHSIRSNIPFLFDGTLPVFNVGTNSGASCDPRVQHSVTTRVIGANGFDAVVNGRFKGGWTTRHYGRPETGVHAIQMELAQRAYLAAEMAPWTFDADVAAPLRHVLAEILGDLDQLARGGL